VTVPRGYRRYHEIERTILALAKKGARVVECGASIERRSIYAVEIGPPRARPLSITIAGLHALEWIGVECSLAWLERMAASPPDERRILAFPVVNVDGYVHVERDLRRGQRRFRRGNARGVDLNRNWPTLYRRRTVGIWNSGASALSEPETRAVSAAIDRATAQGAQDLRAVSLHSTGGKVLYPYGGRWTRARDFIALRDSAERVARILGKPYVAVQSSHWVPGFNARGMEIDHLYEAYGASALLIECGSLAANVRDPKAAVSPFDWFNPRDPAFEVARIGHALDDFLLSEGTGRREDKKV
jgi:hypothetical protein